MSVQPNVWTFHSPRPYRAALRRGRIAPGLTFLDPFDSSRRTVVFVPGSGGVPEKFARVAEALRTNTNCAAFCYLDRSRLVETAERLRAELERIPGPVTVVAHSMGALVTAYAGATDVGARLQRLSALYLNPLIGGSRFAEADPVLAVLGDLSSLRWLHRVKLFVQRTFFPPFVQDLAPESGFIQQIFGAAGLPSSFHQRTRILFTETPGAGPDIHPGRAGRWFDCTRDRLIERLGTVAATPINHAVGHDAPLGEPRLVAQLLESLWSLERCAAELSSPTWSRPVPDR